MSNIYLPWHNLMLFPHISYEKRPTPLFSDLYTTVQSEEVSSNLLFSRWSSSAPLAPLHNSNTLRQPRCFFLHAFKHLHALFVVRDLKLSLTSVTSKRTIPSPLLLLASLAIGARCWQSLFNSRCSLHISVLLLYLGKAILQSFA